MKVNVSCRKLLPILCTVFLSLMLLRPAALAAEIQINNNRFNVVLVMDASNSMNYTDKEDLRFEAIELFTNLLAEKGNTLGGIVFSNGIDAVQPLLQVSSQIDKDAVISVLKSVTPSGYTNTGLALSSAVESLLQDGEPDLPSVIIFLSDGNTEMPTEKEYTVSLEQKANAIYEARKNNIQVYTVCLNANGKADTSEMAQISSATGGVFEEVSSPNDLQDVFNTFYNLIYGTSTITLADDVFASDGTLKTPFQVPGIGVEEVNIIITGKPQDISLRSPDGSTPNVSQISSDLCTFLKTKDVVPGKWLLTTVGTPGTRVKINMVYNLNLEVVAAVTPNEFPIPENQPLQVTAVLQAGSVPAQSADQYANYDAKLRVMNAYHELIETVPMEVRDGSFKAEVSLLDGAYFCSVHVSGNYIEKDSNEIGPISVSAVEEIVNTPPEPVDNPVSKTVYILPFRPATLRVDLTSLAVDADGDPLRFEIVSSSFLEGEDYTVSGDILTMDHFSLFKGDYDIRATDSHGASCPIELVVTSINVGILALILLGIASLICIIVFCILLYIAFTKPFRGAISVRSYSNGVYKGTPRSPMRGRCKLVAFGLDPIGIDYSKCYFQATGQQYIYLITNVPVMWNGQKTSKIKIMSGAETTVSADGDMSRLLYIRFTSRMTGRPGARPRPRRARR